MPQKGQMKCPNKNFKAVTVSMPNSVVAMMKNTK